MSKLTVTILSINGEPTDSATTVGFSAWDGDDTGLVSFEGEISVAHAVYLVEHEMLSDKTAYGKMLHLINQNGAADLYVGLTIET